MQPSWAAAQSVTHQRPGGNGRGHIQRQSPTITLPAVGGRALCALDVSKYSAVVRHDVLQAGFPVDVLLRALRAIDHASTTAVWRGSFEVTCSGRRIRSSTSLLAQLGRIRIPVTWRTSRPQGDTLTFVFLRSQLRVPPDRPSSTSRTFLGLDPDAGVPRSSMRLPQQQGDAS